MLSVCIPIYNFDVRPLVQQLHRQLLKAQTDFEIVLMDDASDEFFQQLNQPLSNFQHCVYIPLSQNVGRAAIRNRLAEKARYDYLLFMDCDAKAPDTFIEKYLQAIDPTTMVIVGGRSYNNIPPKDTRQYLRWYFGMQREVFPAALRRKHPYHSFLTCNFLVKKEVLQTCPFDKRLTQYGHEDTLFGFQLSQNKIPIRHIDNPLEHIQLETAATFLLKTQKSIANLRYINKHIESSSEFIRQVSLLSTWYKLKTWRIAGIYRVFFSLFQNTLEQNLLGKRPKLFVFDLYKLGIMCSTD